MVWYYVGVERNDSGCMRNVGCFGLQLRCLMKCLREMWGVGIRLFRVIYMMGSK